MAKVDRNGERLRRGRWLRALGLAKLLFEDEGYFSDYLEAIEDFVEHDHPGMGGGAVEFYIEDEEIIPVKHCGKVKDCDCYRPPTSNDIALLTLNTATGWLSYASNVGKSLSFKNVKISLSLSKQQITCRMRSVSSDDYDER